MFINNIVEHHKSILLTIGPLLNHFEPKSWKKLEIENLTRYIVKIVIYFGFGPRYILSNHN